MTTTCLINKLKKEYLLSESDAREIAIKIILEVVKTRPVIKNMDNKIILDI